MNQYQPPVRQPYGYPAPSNHHEQMYFRKPLRRWATIIGLGFLIHIGIQFILGIIWSQISMSMYYYDLSPDLRSLIDESASLILYVSSFWPATLFMMARIKIPPEVAFPLKKPRLSITIPGLFVCLGASMVGSFLVSILSWFMEVVLGLYPTMPDFSLPQGIAANIVYVVSMTVAPALFEELMFRGVILQALRRFGDGFALVISSILFGLLHGNLIQGPNAILFGLICGYFVLRTGSILPGIFFHFVNNGLSVVFTYLMEWMNDTQVMILDFAVMTAYILLGIASLIFLVLKFGSLFQVAPSSYPLPTSKKFTAFFFSPAQIAFLAFVIFLTATYLEPI